MVKGACVGKRGSMRGKGGSVHGKGGGMRGKGGGGDVRGSRDGHCSGQYASYWNAFLLIECLASFFYLFIVGVMKLI